MNTNTDIDNALIDSRAVAAAFKPFSDSMKHDALTKMQDAMDELTRIIITTNLEYDDEYYYCQYCGAHPEESEWDDDIQDYIDHELVHYTSCIRLKAATFREQVGLPPV